MRIAVHKALAAITVRAFLSALILCVSACSNDTANLNDPAVIYGDYCFACHDTGAINAPLLSDQAFWKNASSDMPRLYQVTINGYQAMPAKGTCVTCSDEQLKQVVDWMVAQ
ncbi:MAG: hypothetical protein CSA49_04150 [Gammaproteobacteria bacterium]|nr:MAG: hypothetical protein CSA49_04150 [Gammaproteobacteria bacterium]